MLVVIDRASRREVEIFAESSAVESVRDSALIVWFDSQFDPPSSKAAPRSGFAPK
jgi:hypothetical protein